MKQKLTLIIGILSLLHAWGQNEFNTGSSASSEASGIESYSFLPMNLSTGKANISIPIFTIQEGRISYPISLNYSGGGIRVAEKASSVGLGWSLSNSVITRNVVGYHDLNNRAYPEGSSKKTKRMGYFEFKTTNAPMHSSPDGELLEIDYYPDVFNVYSPIFKTRFTFQDLNTPLDLEAKTGKIQYSLFERRMNYCEHLNNCAESTTGSITKDFQSFTLLDDDGIEYHFNDYTLSSTATGAYNGSHLNDRFPSEYSTSNPEVSSWFITKIKDKMSNNEITFEYENYSVDVMSTNNFENAAEKSRIIHSSSNWIFYNMPDKYGHWHLYNFVFPDSNSDCRNRDPANHCKYAISVSPGSGDGRWQYRSAYKRDFKLKRLKKIKFSEGYILFEYNKDRLDEYNEKALTDIKIFNLFNTLIAHYKLNHEYFGRTTDSNKDYYSKRLKLKSLEKVTNNVKYQSKYEFKYNDIQGPPFKNSQAIDFMGFYNDSYNIDKDAIDNPSKEYYYMDKKTSTNLYFYPEKGQYSILPFKVAGVNSYEIPGDFDRTSNNDAKAFILKEVKLPSGGKQEIEYELNSFKIFNKDVIGGGIRVAKQVLKDSDDNILQQKTYEYTLPDGSSSGNLINIPHYGIPLRDFNDLSLWNEKKLYTEFKIQDLGKYDNTINSSYILYSRVTEKETGNGKIVRNFYNKPFESYREGPVPNNISQYNHSPVSCITDFLLRNSNLGNLSIHSNIPQNGKLWKTEIFSEGNNLLKKDSIIYDSKNFGGFAMYGIEPSAINVYKRSNYLGDIPYPSAAAGEFEVYFSNFRTYSSQKYLPKKIISKEYVDGQENINITDFRYENRGFLSESQTTNTRGDVVTNYVHYTNEIQDIILNELTSIAKNSKYGTSVDNSQGFIPQSTSIKYDKINNYIRPIKISHFRNGDVVSINHQKYDNRGNIVETKNEHGVSTVYIWGIKDSKVIAEILGISYSDIPTNIINTLQDISNTRILNVSDFEKLYNLYTTFPDIYITAYIYEPLIGVKKVIKANGFVEEVKYDEGKATEVKNHYGELLNHFEYNTGQ